MTDHTETLAEIDAALAEYEGYRVSPARSLPGSTAQFETAAHHLAPALRKARALIPDPPTDDERECVAELLDADSCWEYNGNHTTFRPLLGADAILAAGYRRHTPSPARRFSLEEKATLTDFAAARIQSVWDDVGTTDATTLAQNVVSAQEFAWLSMHFPVQRPSAEPSPVTDAEVDAGARAHHIHGWGDDLDPHSPMPDEDLLAMRAAFEAARAVRLHG